MTSWDEQFQAAEALRKSGEYEEAERLFRVLWQEHPTAAAGAGWMHCLRKLGRSHEAAAFGSNIAATFPESEWVRREYVWSIYSGELKPAKEQGNLGRVIHFAQEILQFAPDNLAKGKAVFAVIDVAKDATKWDIVSSWCDRLERNQLGIEPNMIEGRKGLSEAERWYFAKVKALVKLKQWAEARMFAMEATVSFPHRVDFYRWAAQARARQGDLVGGVEELDAIIHRGHVQWYILSDLAELQYEMGKSDHSLRNACKAALAPGEDRNKVRLYELLARIQLQAGKLESAGHHVELAKAVRQREGWGINTDLAQLERQVIDKMANAGLAQTPLDLPQLFKLCRRDWEEGIMAGQIRHVGHVSRLIDGKDFAFITPDAGGENVYVKLRDLPRTAQKVDARVEYTLVNAYDKKKERDTVRATDIRLVE